MTALKNGDAAIWMRKTRGGMRRVTPIGCKIATTNGTTAVVSYERRGRRLLRIVQVANLEPVT